MTNSVKQFAVAALEADQEPGLELTHEFGMGGTDYKARLPTKAEVALWMVASGNSDRVAFDETIRFLTAVLHDSTWDDDEGNLLRDEDGVLLDEIPDTFHPDGQMNDIYRRWRDPRDPLDPNHFVPVVRWLIEERANFPTTSSSGSSTGRPASGTSSTRATPRKASTRSRSTPAASAG